MVYQNAWVTFILSVRKQGFMSAVAMISNLKWTFECGEQKVKRLKKRDLQPLFQFWWPCTVGIRGVWYDWRGRLRIWDYEYQLRWYMCVSGCLGDFLKECTKNQIFIVILFQWVLRIKKKWDLKIFEGLILILIVK